MKNKILLLAIVCTTAFVSCSDDDDSTSGGTTQQTTEQKITGNWNGFLNVINYYENGTKIDSLTESYDITDEGYDFNADGNVYYSINNTVQDTFSWNVVNDNTVIIDSLEFSIERLKLLEFYFSTSQDFLDSASGNTITVENYFELTK